MKLTIERAALLRGLGHVQSVVERRNTLPILSNVLLRAEGGSLYFTATDMDLEIRESVVAEIAAEGIATAPAHTLFDISRKLRDGARVELEIADGSQIMTLRSGRSTFTLPCLPADEYPTVAGGTLPHVFTISAGELRQMLDRTRFAMSTEETRHYLNGVYLHTAEHDGIAVIRAAATDGHRLSRVEAPLPDGAAGMPGIILPRKAVVELRKLLDGVEVDVEVALSAAKVRFAFGDIMLISKLIDGTFPDYERVIPINNDKFLTVDAKLLAEAVDRVSTISTEKSRAIKLSLSTGSLTLSSASADAGSATEEIEASYSAADMEIGFNAKYLLDIVAQIVGESVTFNVLGSGSPAIIQDAADVSSVFVLMPLRV
jgi:DNA polymerase-3 subunit beta